MQTLWLEEGSLRLRQDIPLPVPGLDEALIKVRLAGICATDLEMVRGYYPFKGILGHEFVGEVVQAPGHTNWIGQRVVGEINITCGQCHNCKSGRRTHCEQRTTLGIRDRNGAFAEYLTLPVENLHSVPASISDEAAVFTEPLAAALEISQQIHIHPGDHVLVVGAGRLGQIIAQTLTLTGCQLNVVVRHALHQKLLAEQGITTIIEEEVAARQWDIVVEATGSPSGFDLARRALRPRGTLVLKSTYKGNMEVNFSSLVVDEICLVGSRCGPFPPALNLLQRGLVQPARLISERFPFARAQSAFERAAQPGVLKVLLQFQNDPV
ncbi:MAG: alcohol dehydrogenase catalytic domain-containing protein [Chloroflexota bacterium]